MRHHIFYFIILASLFTSCEKEFLEAKPNKALVVPTTLEDFSYLLNNGRVMNVHPSITEIATTDFHNSGIQSYIEIERNSYIWADDIYEGTTISPDWNLPYEQIFYSNVVLDGLQKINRNDNNAMEWDFVKGSALFFRAMAFYNLSTAFTMPYEPESAVSKLGLPLPTAPDINNLPGRSNLQQTFDQILEDLHLASDLLLINADYKTQPSKAASYALLAKVYLTIHDYDKAESFASEALEISNSLLDYNILDSTARAPFPVLNEEVIFHATLNTYRYVTANLTEIDPELYNSYDDNDLRKSLFFTTHSSGRINFRGSYNGNVIPFSGIATDEVYLIRAEARARLGNLSGALKDLNTLMITRWEEGSFEEFYADNTNEILKIILEERRKELLFRGTRWNDLKRLNFYPEFAVTLNRIHNGENYSLPPGSLKYAFPIPDSEIRGSGIEQNPR